MSAATDEKHAKKDGAPAERKESAGYVPSPNVPNSKEATVDQKPSATSANEQRSKQQVSVMKYVTDAERKELNLREFVLRHLSAGAKKMEYQAKEVHALLESAKEEFQKSPTLLELEAPVNICGDIHGQYADLLRIFGACGWPFRARYLFLGDYVDRGRHSLEVICLLLACRIQFQYHVYLLRGNHELANINKVYGFMAELKQRFKGQGGAEAMRLYNHFNDVFSFMPLAAVVSKRILCMHGGLSPELNSLDDIRKIQRPIKIARGLAQDLLWADPEAGIKGFQANKIRAVSHIFGEEVVHQKCKQLDIDLVVRAHQVVEFGYAFFAQRALITVFSAARYHDELLNYAAVVKVDEALETTFVQLKPQEFDRVRQELQKKRQTTNNVDDNGDDEEEGN